MLNCCQPPLVAGRCFEVCRLSEELQLSCQRSATVAPSPLRARFGNKTYDDAIARGRIAQAFGRLIRRADDKGCFVMLDAAAPTRLFSGLPPGVELQRVTLVEAIEAVGEFLAR